MLTKLDYKYVNSKYSCFTIQVHRNSLLDIVLSKEIIFYLLTTIKKNIKMLEN